MSITRLSSKGQLIIPKPVRRAHCWDAGQELEVIDMEEGVLLKTKSPFHCRHGHSRNGMGIALCLRVF